MASDHQKQILQYLLHKPMLTAHELMNVYQTIFQKSTNLDELKGLARTLNDLLKPAQLAIKHRLCEDTNTDIFVLISLTETEAAKHISEFSPPELDFFKHIMKEILASSNGSVSSIDCINFSSAIQKLSKSEAQKALDKFFTSQWLKEKDGEVSFTVRTLLELEPLLKKLDPDLGECKICGSLAVKVLVCPNEECAIRVHRFCLSKMSRSNSALKCPRCQSVWTATNSNMDDSSSSSHSRSPAAHQVEQGRSNGNGTSSSRRRTASKRIMDSSDEDNV